jgi:D-beta-D-heptose 7-phosphate kinase/D-beta-D-heptose 1-phosphate adenosyltransferase
VKRRIVVVGDLMLDRDLNGRTERIAPDAPVPVFDIDQVRESPGGAGLTALLCTAPDVEVLLIAPVSEDQAGARLTDQLRRRIELLPLPHEGGTRTKIRIRSAGQSLLRLDEGGPGTPVRPRLEPVRAALAAADVVLVSDYGAGTTSDPGLRELLAHSAARIPLIWDPHPRGGPPVTGATLVTPNVAEATAAMHRERPRTDGRPPAPPDELAMRLREFWQSRGVCVTAAAAGAYLALAGSEPLFVPAPVVEGGDPCGAGDRFAASAALALARGAVLSEAVIGAVQDASAWVAGGGAAAYRSADDASANSHPATPFVPSQVHGPDSPDPVAALMADVRARGGRIVATGGCFDILHVGHISCLEAARRAGDALIVLLNSDESVRRLKGPHRPVVPAPERARVLQALQSVDAVVVFDEDTPEAALDRLRPDIWAKGGDYGGTPLPEAELVRSWGGRILLLPYLDGRSTTAILTRTDLEAR